MSALLEQLLAGPRTDGIAMSRRHVRFEDYVVSLTATGCPRMPNGIVCDIDAERSRSIEIGGGQLRIGGVVLTPRDRWDARPSFPVFPVRARLGGIDIGQLAGRGPGLTPAGDDFIAGYVAGLTLLHGSMEQAGRIARQAAPLTNSLSRTLLRHAALGEVPEPVHDLLRTGDATALLGFGHTSGPWWLQGLVLAGYPPQRIRSARRAA